MKKILVIGLGSMGKRRIRCLKALGIDDITGVDTSFDRCEEAKTKYGVNVSTEIDKVLANESFDCWIISLPPLVHHTYIKKAIAFGVPCFVEASVLDTDFDQIIKESDEKKVLVAPSCTLWFHEAIKKIKEFIDNGSLGDISSVIYHSGQYLPDWHTYEPVSDYYVSNPLTGGAREIVPFEMTWISKIFGFPKSVAGIFKKTINILGAENIDDTYNILMDYEGFIINLNVDVVSRYGTRRLTINGSTKQLVWSWDDSVIKTFDPVANKWDEHSYEVASAEDGYNKNIAEQMYVDEVKSFLDAAMGKSIYPNTMMHDKQVLNVLYKAEESYKTLTFKQV